MNENSDALNHVSHLVDQLADNDAVVRETSRKQLIQLGTHDVTGALVLALIDPQTHVRGHRGQTLFFVFCNATSSSAMPRLSVALPSRSRSILRVRLPMPSGRDNPNRGAKSRSVAAVYRRASRAATVRAIWPLPRPEKRSVDTASCWATVPSTVSTFKPAS